MTLVWAASTRPPAATAVARAAILTTNRAAAALAVQRLQAEWPAAHHLVETIDVHVPECKWRVFLAP